MKITIDNKNQMKELGLTEEQIEDPSLINNGNAEYFEDEESRENFKKLNLA